MFVADDTVPFERAMTYVRRIRNRQKREYARSYLLYLSRGGCPPSSMDVAYMASQAVRMNLHDLYGYCPE